VDAASGIYVFGDGSVAVFPTTGSRLPDILAPWREEGQNEGVALSLILET